MHVFSKQSINQTIHHTKCFCNNQVSLKFIAHTSNKELLKQVEKEIACLRSVSHPNVVSLLKKVDSPHHFVLVGEHMDGGDLLSYMLAQEKGFTVFEKEATTIILQLVNALSHMHYYGVIHKSISLEHVLLSSSSSPFELVKLSGFHNSEFCASDQSLRYPTQGGMLLR